MIQLETTLAVFSNEELPELLSLQLGECEEVERQQSVGIDTHVSHADPRYGPAGPLAKVSLRCQSTQHTT